MTEAEYRAGLARVNALVDQDPDLGSPEGLELHELANRLILYEAEHVNVPTPTDEARAAFRAEQAANASATTWPWMGRQFERWQASPTLHPFTCSGGGGACAGVPLACEWSTSSRLELRCPQCSRLQVIRRGTMLWSLLDSALFDGKDADVLAPPEGSPEGPSE